MTARVRIPKVALVFGTRPEAVKLAPVIKALGQPDAGLQPVAITTGQHRQMLDQVLDVFGIAADHDLGLMQPGQSLGSLSGAVLAALEPVLAAERPDLLLVQGDTTTVVFAALAAFYGRIPVGHVEAGLRTDDRDNPFPEEINRRLTSVLTTLHFAPVERARQNLLAEGVPANRIHVTGNTVVDALHSIRQNERFLRRPLPFARLAGSRLLLVTLHRRESWGEPLVRVCRAVCRLAARFPDLQVVYPVHLNPAVRATVFATLGGVERINLLEPVDYLGFVRLMEEATIILTDSGGIQEEAPELGKPVLVARVCTERPEAIESGAALLVGTAEESIVAAATRLLTDPAAYARIAQVRHPFGDGRAAERIVAVCRDFLGGPRPQPAGP